MLIWVLLCWLKYDKSAAVLPPVLLETAQLKNEISNVRGNILDILKAS